LKPWAPDLGETTVVQRQRLGRRGLVARVETEPHDERLAVAALTRKAQGSGTFLLHDTGRHQAERHVAGRARQLETVAHRHLTAAVESNAAYPGGDPGLRRIGPGDLHAHFGRGRGDYVAGEYPPHWGAVVDAAVSTQRATLDEIWSAAAAGVTADALESRLRPLLEAVASDVLGRLYPLRA